MYLEFVVFFGVVVDCDFLDPAAGHDSLSDVVERGDFAIGGFGEGVQKCTVVKIPYVDVARARPSDQPTLGLVETHSRDLHPVFHLNLYSVFCT